MVDQLPNLLIFTSLIDFNFYFDSLWILGSPNRYQLGVYMNFVAFLLAVLSTSSFAEGLYKLNGKTVQKSDLPVGTSQSLFELEAKHRESIQMIIDEGIFTSYAQEESKKRNKPVNDIITDILKVKDPSEKEAKTFYEANKARIPGAFDAVKGEIISYLKKEKEEKAKIELINKIKKKGGFEFLVSEPVAPVLEINLLGAPSKGKKGAKVKIVEFADYQCPHCRHAHEVLGKYMKKMDSKVEFVYLDFPINRSGISRRVSEGAFCANQLGKFWEYHDMAFEQQEKLTNEYPLEMAKALKLDEAQFKKCFDGEEAKSWVKKSSAEAERIGIAGTPSVYLNGQRVLDWTEEGLAKQVDKALR